jgi:hypothetical protein
VYRLSLRFGFSFVSKPRYTRSLRFYTTTLTPPLKNLHLKNLAKSKPSNV